MYHVLFFSSYILLVCVFQCLYKCLYGVQRLPPSQVKVSGCAVLGKESCDGVYNKTEEKLNGFALYQHNDNKDRLLRRTPAGKWKIGDSDDVRANNELGWVFSNEPGMLHPDECTWAVDDGKDWVQGGRCEAYETVSICIA